jgi:cell division septum initiation protein DivIVA
MAGNNSGNSPTEMAEQAMNRLLQAERDARRVVAECEAEAASILQAAQLQASRVASRTDSRISLMQTRCFQRVTEEIKHLERAATQARERQAESYRIDETGLAECIEEIAICLTGGVSRGGDGGDVTE